MTYIMVNNDTFYTVAHLKDHSVPSHKLLTYKHLYYSRIIYYSGKRIAYTVMPTAMGPVTERGKRWNTKNGKKQLKHYSSHELVALGMTFRAIIWKLRELSWMVLLQKNSFQNTS